MTTEFYTPIQTGKDNLLYFLQVIIDSLQTWMSGIADQGSTGAQGVKGDTGDTGPQGSQGTIGLTGSTGSQGAKGDKGDTGSTGSAGATGSQGLIGLTGAQGNAGASFNIQAAVAQSFTSDTAFQPRSGGPCAINVIASLSGTLGANQTLTVATCSTSNGSYTTVSTIRLTLALTGVSDDKSTGVIFVPSGYWVKITVTGAITTTCLRWDL